MILKADKIAEMLTSNDKGRSDDPLVITPTPSIEHIQQSGAASIDLRLGTWFVTLLQSRMPYLDINETPSGSQLTKTHYVPFGKPYWLHPRSFVLGVTLEWMRIPTDLAGDVTGKSSWGRRGLIIATATGVHPGFKGCLTLELTNLGEIPIAIYPGMTICQLRLFEVTDSSSSFSDNSQFVGLRKPTLGEIHLDEMAKRLAKSHS